MIRRNYLVQFVDGDHAWSEGRDGMHASRAAEQKWGVPVKRYQLPGLNVAWVRFSVIPDLLDVAS